MMQAHQRNSVIKGIKGRSPFAAFSHFNLNWSYGLDYMHTVCLGNVKHLISLWQSDKRTFFNNKESISNINGILKNSRGPRLFTRPLNNLWEGLEWKASQCKNFLLFKGPAALEGNLKTEYYNNFIKLSQAIFIFLKESITQEEFKIGSKLIFEFLFEFQHLYGVKNMRFNVHLLTHLPLSCLYNGPLWCNSLYSFESKNRFLNLLINGTNNIIQEAASKISITQQKFIGKNLRRKIRKNCFESDIYSSSPKKYIKSKQFYGFTINDCFEIKNFIYKNSFYEKFDVKKKTDDSFIEVNETLYQIVKILIKNSEVFLLLKNDYKLARKQNHINFVESTDCHFKIIRVSEAIKKAIFIENSLNYFVFPNQIEFE